LNIQKDDKAEIKGRTLAPPHTNRLKLGNSVGGSSVWI